MRSLWLSVAAAIAFACGNPTNGQELPPDYFGEAVTSKPNYQGQRADVPIPPSMHKKNEGGSDGAGLCVIASCVASLRYQGYPKEAEALWIAAKQEPGGYSPQKLDRLLKRVAPHLKYAHYLGSDPEVLTRLSHQGIPSGVTISTGRLYGGQHIDHMVTLSHHDPKWSALIDNNRPGFWSWMPSSVFNQRWVGGGGWAVAFESALKFGAFVILAGALIGAFIVIQPEAQPA